MGPIQFHLDPCAQCTEDPPPSKTLYALTSTQASQENQAAHQSLYVQSTHPGQCPHYKLPTGSDPLLPGHHPMQAAMCTLMLGTLRCRGRVGPPWMSPQAQQSPGGPRYLVSCAPDTQQSDGSPYLVSSQLPHPHHFPPTPTDKRPHLVVGLPARTDTAPTWAHTPAGREVTALGSWTPWGCGKGAPSPP